MVAEQAHDQHLAEHARMDSGRKVSNATRRRSCAGALNSMPSGNSAREPRTISLSEGASASETQLPQFSPPSVSGGAFPSRSVLPARRESRARRASTAVLTECRGVNDGALERVVDGL